MSPTGMATKQCKLKFGQSHSLPSCWETVSSNRSSIRDHTTFKLVAWQWPNKVLEAHQELRLESALMRQIWSSARTRRRSCRTLCCKLDGQCFKDTALLSEHCGWSPRMFSAECAMHALHLWRISSLSFMVCSSTFNLEVYIVLLILFVSCQVSPVQIELEECSSVAYKASFWTSANDLILSSWKTYNESSTMWKLTIVSNYQLQARHSSLKGLQMMTGFVCFY